MMRSNPLTYKAMSKEDYDEYMAHCEFMDAMDAFASTDWAKIGDAMNAWAMSVAEQMANVFDSLRETSMFTGIEATQEDYALAGEKK